MAQPKNASDLFDNVLPAALLAAPDRARALDSIFLFEVTDAGVWVVDLVSSPPTCTRGWKSTAQITLKMTTQSFDLLLKDPAQAMQLYFQGRIVISGNPMLATKLLKLLELVNAA